ncbi:hypothetical protein STEG23_037000 [Scotinomys teguina]
MSREKAVENTFQLNIKQYDTVCKRILESIFHIFSFIHMVINTCSVDETHSIMLLRKLKVQHFQQLSMLIVPGEEVAFCCYYFYDAYMFAVLYTLLSGHSLIQELGLCAKACFTYGPILKYWEMECRISRFGCFVCLRIKLELSNGQENKCIPYWLPNRIRFQPPMDDSCNYIVGHKVCSEVSDLRSSLKFSLDFQGIASA